jgi:hypothetical protein
LTATSLQCPELYPEVIAALYYAFWVEKKGVQLPEVHKAILSDILGPEQASIVMERVRYYIADALS